MSDKSNINPFVGLFTTISHDSTTLSSGAEIIVENHSESANNGQQINHQNQTPKQSSEFFASSQECNRDDRLDELIADVFGITLSHDECKKPTRQLVLIDSDSIEHAVFERLLLTDPESMLISKENTKGQDLDSHVIQTEIIPYLFESYCRLQRYRVNDDSEETVESIRKIIVRDISTALQEPDLFVDQEVHMQFVGLFMNGGIVSSELSTFIAGIVEHLCSENVGCESEVITAAFSPVLDIIHKDAAQSDLLVFKQYWFCILQTFATLEPLGKLIISHSSPKSKIGKAYTDTLLGSLLSLSCLPKGPNAPYPFFDKPFQQHTSAVEGNIWTALDTLSESMHRVFHALLKCSRDVRHLTLLWLGDCLHSNAERGTLSNLVPSYATFTTVSDGFMLNLSNVLLRLCQPFCAKSDDPKVLKIDPTYCAAEAKDANDSREKGLHMKGMSTQTCCVPTPEGETRPIATSFSFVTECFYLTHRALDLGNRVVNDKLYKAQTVLSRIQRQFTGAGLGSISDESGLMSQEMESSMTEWLSLRASLLCPESLSALAKFYAATAFWLMQVIVDDRPHVLDQDNYFPNEYKTITFPLPDRAPDMLRCIPEFLVENAVRFLCLLRSMCPNVFEEQGPNLLNPILTEIMALMESPIRLYNPHLRARLAEGLEALLPVNDRMNNQITPTLGTFHRQQLFATHPHKQMIVPSLLQVFVNIEMTGQGVDFDDKVRYRRPMYSVMSYVWKLPDHRNSFKLLAEEAEANMEAVHPPLFLKFIDNLMNDAQQLLVDALLNIEQLKELTRERENGEWDRLPESERQMKEHDFDSLVARARRDNVLGRETIRALKMLTSEIKSIFCQPTLADRIAPMLDHLLLQLVGPHQKKLKVKDQKEYDFYPAELVLNICEIYINLSQNDSFALAVSQDGRSYSPQLFKFAGDVLVRTGGAAILGDLDEFAKKVESVAMQKREKEEYLADAPDEFLDPITCTLMTDPVILPTSKKIVDRQTIARHLLSDQSDPFNRQPLSYDEIKSAVDLKIKIDEWLESKGKTLKAQASDS